MASRTSIDSVVWVGGTRDNWGADKRLGGLRFQHSLSMEGGRTDVNNIVGGWRSSCADATRLFSPMWPSWADKLFGDYSAFSSGCSFSHTWLQADATLHLPVESCLCLHAPASSSLAPGPACATACCWGREGRDPLPCLPACHATAPQSAHCTRTAHLLLPCHLSSFTASPAYTAHSAVLARFPPNHGAELRLSASVLSCRLSMGAMFTSYLPIYRLPA